MREGSCSQLALKVGLCVCNGGGVPFINLMVMGWGEVRMVFGRWQGIQQPQQTLDFNFLKGTFEPSFHSFILVGAESVRAR